MASDNEAYYDTDCSQIDSSVDSLQVAGGLQRQYRHAGGIGKHYHRLCSHTVRIKPRAGQQTRPAGFCSRRQLW
jgi:hypothetical protein